MNIEIDGPHHKQPVKRRFCRLRDAYLREVHGVIVLRLDVMELQRLPQAQRVAHIQERLRELSVSVPAAAS